MKKGPLFCTEAEKTDFACRNAKAKVRVRVRVRVR